MDKKQGAANFVKQVFTAAKNNIIEQAKTELSGNDKKANVDSAVINFIKMNIKNENPLVCMLINILLEYVPVITQCIYEYLKKYVDGLTEV